MKKQVLGWLAVLAMVADASSPASFYNAHVANIRIDQDGRDMVFFDTAAIGSPATCINPTYSGALAFDSRLSGGKAILAIATAAKAQRSLMTVHGTGTCDIYNGAHAGDWYYGIHT